MAKKRLYPLLLALCLLAGCGSSGTDTPEPSPPPEPVTQEAVGQEQQTPPPEVAQTPEPEQEPEPEDLPPTWDEAHRLSVDYTPARSGSLELPSRGATGYAAVELPLWETKPEDPPPEEPSSETEETPPETTAPTQPEQPAAPTPPPVETTPPAEAGTETPPAETPAAPSETTGEGTSTPETPPIEATVSTDPPWPEEPSASEPAAEGEALPTESETTPTEGTSAETSQEPSMESGTPQESTGERDAPSTPLAEETPSSEETPPAKTTPPESAPSAEITAPTPTAEGTPTPSTKTPAGTLQTTPGEVPPVPAEEPPREEYPYEGALAVLAPGTAFTVLEQDGDWWRVETKEHTGWIEHRYCMVNLPDVVPSIIYDAINSYDSRYRSVGKPLPDVTGRSLYPGKTYNPRLDREEFMMPVLYAMAIKLCRAQQAALAEGNSLILYEGYRPYSTQRAVVKALTQLSQEDPEVEAGIATKPWNLSWFIATGYSNHQRGSAVDMGLAKVLSAELDSVGERTYPRALEWAVYEMPTPIHELSIASVIYTAPNSGELAPAMNDPALGLQRYCTGAGLSPLSSEWWHFDDWAARRNAEDNLCTGGFQIDTCLSRQP